MIGKQRKTERPTEDTKIEKKSSKDGQQLVMRMFSRRFLRKELPDTSQSELSNRARPASPLFHDRLSVTVALSHDRWSIRPFLPFLYT